MIRKMKAIIISLLIIFILSDILIYYQSYVDYSIYLMGMNNTL